jgi:hypothetical protein
VCMAQRKTWSDMGKKQQLSVIVGGAVQVALLVAALVDIKRRPAELIRGGKVLWVLLSFVNYVGPLAYFVVGRRRAETAVV